MKSVGSVYNVDNDGFEASPPPRTEHQLLKHNLIKMGINPASPSKQCTLNQLNVFCLRACSLLPRVPGACQIRHRRHPLPVSPRAAQDAVAEFAQVVCKLHDRMIGSFQGVSALSSPAEFAVCSVKLCSGVKRIMRCDQNSCMIKSRPYRLQCFLSSSAKTSASPDPSFGSPLLSKPRASNSRMSSLILITFAICSGSRASPSSFLF